MSILQEALAEPELNLNCKSVQKRLATVWGYVKAEQAEQEPVAAYKDAPRVIYLQTGCEDPEFCECSFNEWGDTTWCADKIHDTDIPYIREDYTAPVRTKDLTDEDKLALWKKWNMTAAQIDAVIAAYKEKNNA